MHYTGLSCITCNCVRLLETASIVIEHLTMEQELSSFFFIIFRLWTGEAFRGNAAGSLSKLPKRTQASRFLQLCFTQEISRTLEE